jgi:hypothetical protein
MNVDLDYILKYSVDVLQVPYSKRRIYRQACRRSTFPAGNDVDLEVKAAAPASNTQTSKGKQKATPVSTENPQKKAKYVYDSSSELEKNCSVLLKFSIFIQSYCIFGEKSRR